MKAATAAVLLTTTMPFGLSAETAFLSLSCDGKYSTWGSNEPESVNKMGR
jgi:hypothetical protein